MTLSIWGCWVSLRLAAFLWQDHIPSPTRCLQYNAMCMRKTKRKKTFGASPSSDPLFSRSSDPHFFQATLSSADLFPQHSPLRQCSQHLPRRNFLFRSSTRSFYSGGLQRTRAMRFTNFCGYFSPFFVSALPRAHPRRSKCGSPVLQHNFPGEWQEYSWMQRRASSAHTRWQGTFHARNLVRLRNFFPIMQ